MKKISVLAIFATACITCTTSRADYSDSKFRAEIKRGLDIVDARKNGLTATEYVYGPECSEPATPTPFIPTNMYVRFGGGVNLPFASEKATFNGSHYEMHNAYSATIGLGLNITPHWRAEIDATMMEMQFHTLHDKDAYYRTGGAMLYLDMLPRYEIDGETVHRYMVTPFVGIGIDAGIYRFDDADGANGFVIALPRAEIGFNVMLNNTIGIDIAYQYQMMAGHGFGWNVPRGGTDDISNIMISLRANF